MIGSSEEKIPLVSRDREVWVLVARMVLVLVARDQRMVLVARDRPTSEVWAAAPLSQVG